MCRFVWLHRNWLINESVNRKLINKLRERCLTQRLFVREVEFVTFFQADSSSNITTLFDELGKRKSASLTNSIFKAASQSLKEHFCSVQLFLSVTPFTYTCCPIWMPGVQCLAQRHLSHVPADWANDAQTQRSTSSSVHHHTFTRLHSFFPGSSLCFFLFFVHFTQNGSHTLLNETWHQWTCWKLTDWLCLSSGLHPSEEHLKAN